ncbi:hypothetical protein EJB05_18255 [Eragrostis curvula]|uniref:RRM domain-containing protein n=1 Tax=Eragrostis curvula TaxID=38414 RepID=A0A5J9VLI5_9POAL|nr:hypothetical protein EJB05_18255 [Eragrostis curvula]
MARNPGRTVYIGNLDEKVSERVLYEILIQPGHVVDLYIPCDKESNRRRGYAFAEYETEEIAQYAVRLFSGLVRINDKLLKFTIAGHDKPTSNGNQHPVIPKLNPIPLPKQSQLVRCSDLTVSHNPAYPVVNGGNLGFGSTGHDKPTSNGNRPVMPKLNPIPLPKQTVSHNPVYPVVNGENLCYGSTPNLNPYGIRPQALSGAPMHNHGQLNNGMYDYSGHAFGSSLNVAYRSPLLNIFAHGAAQQPITHPSY